MLAAVVFAGLATTPAAAQTETITAPGWKFRADLQNTGIYDDRGIRPNSVEKWHFGMPGNVLSTPAIVNNVIYVASWSVDAGGTRNTGFVSALSTSTGAKLWDYTTEGRVSSSPAVVNKPFSISGTLNTTDGTPIAGATIQLQKNISGTSTNVPDKSPTTTTTRISSSKLTVHPHTFSAVNSTSLIIALPLHTKYRRRRFQLRRSWKERGSRISVFDCSTKTYRLSH